MSQKFASKRVTLLDYDNSTHIIIIKINAGKKCLQISTRQNIYVKILTNFTISYNLRVNNKKDGPQYIHNNEK